MKILDDILDIILLIFPLWSIYYVIIMIILFSAVFYILYKLMICILKNIFDDHIEDKFRVILCSFIISWGLCYLLYQSNIIQIFAEKVQIFIDTNCSIESVINKASESIRTNFIDKLSDIFNEK
jgi:hypothetical protein